MNRRIFVVAALMAAMAFLLAGKRFRRLLAQ